MPTLSKQASSPANQVPSTAFGSNLQEGASPPKMNAPEKMFAIGWAFFATTPGDARMSYAPLSSGAVEPDPPPRPR
jgi:hypothetical protein